MEIATPKASTNGSHMITPNRRARLTPKPSGLLAEQIPFPEHNDYIDTNMVDPNLLEETFTVMSILKELNMEKYSALFQREEIDLFVFLMLTYDDMVELCIDETDRFILLNAIHCYTQVFGNPETMYY